MAPRPRLRTILLILSLIILLLPLGGIAVLRLYENELIKRTESELISQAALIVAYYKQEYLDLLEDIEEPIKRSNLIKGNSISFTPPPPVESPDGLTPVLPELDLAKSRIYPPADIPVRLDIQPEPLAKKAEQN